MNPREQACKRTFAYEQYDTPRVDQIGNLVLRTFVKQ